MPNQSTYLDEQLIDMIVKISGQEIRDFLDFLVTKDTNSAFARSADWPVLAANLDPQWHKIAENFQQQPDAYSDTVLVENGRCYQTAVNHPVRIEVRRTDNVPGAAQVAAKGIAGDFRLNAIERIKATAFYKRNAFEVKLSGTSSFEFNTLGVDKALPLIYLAHHWESILRAVGYQPGVNINALKHRTVIIADGDGTTYGMPKSGELPVLKDSPACAPLLKYLHSGGVYVIISGNNLQRTLDRINNAIDDDLKKNVIVAANGCADLAVYTANDYRMIESYRLNAIGDARNKPNAAPLDAIYIGDDGKSDGNDFPAFNEIGFDRSFYVGEDRSAGIFPSLLKGHVRGFESGTARILSYINQLSQQREQGVLFTEKNIEAILQRVGG
ncbi:MAG: hypothetical protein KC684_04810 [Candidatus Omnitrophica bacterium]|nr:hypothetical protein [Candidatus Omnitrophota bacterium]